MYFTGRHKSRPEILKKHLTKSETYVILLCENKQTYSFSPYGIGFAVNIGTD